jgi:hypothetical protein
MMWAYTLIYLGLIARAYDAIYFCANAYTTLGYGSVDLEAHWRLISPIIGISGLFTFAWSTSALIDVVSSRRQLIDQLEDGRERKLNLRSTLRKAEWDGRIASSDRSADRTIRAGPWQSDRGARQRRPARQSCIVVAPLPPRS